MLAEGTKSGIGRIKIVGRSTKVVEHDGLTVLETIGNIATGNDNVLQWGGGYNAHLLLQQKWRFSVDKSFILTLSVT